MSEPNDFLNFPPTRPGLRPNWLIGVGAVLMALGVLALLDAASATLASMIVFGVLLILSGVALLMQSFAHRAIPGSRFWVTALMGVAYILCGFLFVKEPETGSVFITAAVAGCLIASGIMRCFWAAGHRHVPNWWTLVVSAVVALLTGILVYITLPWSGLWLIGTFIGIEMLIAGASAVAFGLSLKRK